MYIDNETLFDVSEHDVDENGVFTVPFGVSKIGKECFERNLKLKKVIIPSSVTYIDNYAFYKCSNLKDIVFSNSIKTIGNHVFTFSGIEEIVLPKSITEIGNYAFRKCQNLKHVTLPENLKKLSTGIFSCCESLEYIKIPPKVRTILSYAISGCENLKKVEFTGPVKISNHVFATRTDFAELEIVGIQFLKEVKADSFVLNALSKKDQKIVLEMIFGKSIDGFSVNSKKELTKIDENAINSEGLMIIPAGVKILNSNFVPCSLEHKIKKVVLPSTLKKISSHAFYGCENLEEIMFCDGIEEIGVRAFYRCLSLKSITVPSSMKRISTYAFMNSGLESVKINSETRLDSGVFLSCSKLKNIELPNGITNIPKHTFAGCGSLEKILLPETITSIENSAFQNCINLKEINLPKKLTLIKESSFRNCSSLAKDTKDRILKIKKGIL